MGGGDDQDAIVNPGHRIILELDFGAQDAPVTNNANTARAAGGRGGRFTGDGMRPDAAMHRRLSTILRNLVETEHFRTSRQAIEIPDVGAFTVSDFFTHFSAATQNHENRYSGYWGMISDARLGADDTLWLNSGGRADVSICVPIEVVDDFQVRFEPPGSAAFINFRRRFGRISLPCAFATPRSNSAPVQSRTFVSIPISLLIWNPSVTNFEYTVVSH